MGAIRRLSGMALNEALYSRHVVLPPDVLPWGDAHFRAEHSR